MLAIPNATKLPTEATVRARCSRFHDASNAVRAAVAAAPVTTPSRSSASLSGMFPATVIATLAA